jgi:3-methyladenine DNA glycosylase/8-oxoguanine DNA glycosylase
MGTDAEERTVALPYAPPYDWPAMAAFFAARAVPGVERVDEGGYRRTIALGGLQGSMEVAPVSGRQSLALTVRSSAVGAMPEIVARVRRMFHLEADVAAATAHLLNDPLIAPLLAARPGLRVPGSWDGFELAVRVVLGQQVTLSSARQLAGRLAAAHGVPMARPRPGLTTVFPGPERLAGRGLAALGMPRARALALSGLAAAAAADPALFAPGGGEPEARIGRLRALRGVGDWTAQYIALRALRDPDAFPATDIGLLRAAAAPGGRRPSPKDLLARAEAWRPWRAWAAQHLWAADAAARARKEDVA